MAGDNSSKLSLKRFIFSVNLTQNLQCRRTSAIHLDLNGFCCKDVLPFPTEKLL